MPKCIHDFWLDPSQQGIFLISDWYGRAQPTVGNAIPRKAALGCVRNQNEHAREQASEQRSFVASASVPVSRILL